MIATYKLRAIKKQLKTLEEERCCNRVIAVIIITLGLYNCKGDERAIKAIKIFYMYDRGIGLNYWTLTCISGERELETTVD